MWRLIQKELAELSLNASYNAACPVRRAAIDIMHNDNLEESAYIVLVKVLDAVIAGTQVATTAEIKAATGSGKEGSRKLWYVYAHLCRTRLEAEDQVPQRVAEDLVWSPGPGVTCCSRRLWWFQRNPPQTNRGQQGGRKRQRKLGTRRR